MLRNDNDIEYLYEKAFNYDLTPLISEFDLYEFCIQGRKKIGEKHAGFLVITPNQYIMGYNYNFGRGSHNTSFARVLAEIEGKKLKNQEDVVTTAIECKKRFLTARISYDVTGYKANSMPIYTGSISFELQKESISEEEFLIFEQFYREYNKDIQLLNANFKFKVRFVTISDKDENGILIRREFKNLDYIYEYLKNHIVKKENIDEEKIIGVSRKK